MLKEIKNIINKTVSNLILKSKLSKDTRLTQRPAFELFFGQQPGIKHPEVSPTLPLLKYVHDNTPSIKVATMRLRESIFRRGFEWEEKFECKCANKTCNKEFDDVVEQCDECGSKEILKPNKREILNADKFFERCNIYTDNNKDRRRLLHLLKEIEDDINIYDDAYIIGIKEYWQDADGNIIRASLHEIVRGNPVMMRIVANEQGERGGRWATCLRHRDIIEDIVGDEDGKRRCPKCGRKLYEVHYVSVEGGGDSPKTYYIGDEVVHVSKYSPSTLYGFSPIVTLWQNALTLTNMTEYIYRAYTESHLPKGVLAMKTSNPDSAVEFWRDVDDKLHKNPHYIPKMFLEGEGNGTGSGMEFVKFMDTLEEMQYIPVRDEIRRTIASIYGVTNIFIGDTSGVGGLNSESTQIDITNMAAESGIIIYNDYIMPEILKWLNISDWKYVLNSPFEENEQRELNENQSKVNIAQSMLNMGFQVALGEKDIFDFKYSGQAQNPNQQQFGGGFGGNDEFGGGEMNPESEMTGSTGSTGSGAKEYIKNPQDAPQGVNVKRGPKGSYYYENKNIEKAPNVMEINRERRIKELLDSTHEHYSDLLDEYKHIRDINPNRAAFLQEDIDDVRDMINRLHHEYDEIGKDVEKDNEFPNININIQKKMSLNEYLDRVSKLTGTKIKMKNPVSRASYENLSVDAGRWLTEGEFEDKIMHQTKKSLEIEKYLGEQQDNLEMRKFKTELNKIFDEEIAKIMENAGKFSGDEIKTFTKKVLDDAIYKMNIHTKRFIENAYKSGQNYVGSLIKQSIDFSKVDKSAIDVILSKHVLWDSYENLTKSTSEQINKIITESYSDPSIFSVSNLVNKMKEVADAENYRLERIARTETHAAAMKGREVSFQKFDPEGQYLYKWSVRHDTRTSAICKEIEDLVNKENNGKGIPLNKLNEILKKVSLKHNGTNWEYRDWVPHINCRSGLVRIQ